MHQADVRICRISRVSSSMSDGAGSKVGLEVMPIASVTLSDGRGPGERAPTRRYGAGVGKSKTPGGHTRMGDLCRHGLAARQAASWRGLMSCKPQMEPDRVVLADVRP